MSVSLQPNQTPLLNPGYKPSRPASIPGVQVSRCPHHTHLMKLWTQVLAMKKSPFQPRIFINFTNIWENRNLYPHPVLLLLAQGTRRCTCFFFTRSLDRGHDMMQRSVLIIYDHQFFIAWSPLIMHDMMHRSAVVIYDQQCFIVTITIVMHEQ